MLFQQQPISKMQFNNNEQKKDAASIPETNFFSFCVSTQCWKNIYDRKYLAVKITDFCLPSEKLIKCLTLLKHLTVTSRKLFCSLMYLLLFVVRSPFWSSRFLLFY